MKEDKPKVVYSLKDKIINFISLAMFIGLLVGAFIRVFPLFIVSSGGVLLSVLYGAGSKHTKRSIPILQIIVGYAILLLLWAVLLSICIESDFLKELSLIILFVVICPICWILFYFEEKKKKSQKENETIKEISMKTSENLTIKVKKTSMTKKENIIGILWSLFFIAVIISTISHNLPLFIVSSILFFGCVVLFNMTKKEIRESSKIEKIFNYSFIFSIWTFLLSKCMQNDAIQSVAIYLIVIVIVIFGGIMYHKENKKDKKKIEIDENGSESKPE